MVEEPGQNMLTKVIDTYFISNSFDKDKNPNSTRIITFRYMANLSKYDKGYEFLTTTDLAGTFSTVFDTYGSEKNLIAAAVHVLNNVFVCEDKSIHDKLGDKVLGLSKKIWENVNHTNETVVKLC